jgi:hypothetical protein
MNSSSQIQIYNMALNAIGNSQNVQDLNESSQQINVLNTFWDAVIDQVLQAFPWGFAMKYVSLQQISLEVQGWGFCYAYPSDCLQARLILPNMQTNSVDLVALGYCCSFGGDGWGLWDRNRRRFDFAVVSDETNGRNAIATDLPDAILAYTARVITIPLWSPAMVNAVTWLLASKIVAPLSASPDYATMAGKAYESALLEAGALSLNEGKERHEPESDLITCRY